MDIIAEEKDFFVVNKPAGLLVHETPTSTEPTLVRLLVKHDPALAGVGEATRPGIVHRLDRDTSGVMVVARTPAMYEYLKQKFAAHEIKKEYVALVHGRLPKDEGEITFTIGRGRRGGRMAARPAGAEGRAAKTIYEVIKRFPHLTLVRVFPETGRTHQIRAHFHALGHPIVGDPLYRTKAQRKEVTRGYKRLQEVTRGYKVPRMMLHALKISFRDPTHHDYTFEAPLPPEFAQLTR